MMDHDESHHETSALSSERIFWVTLHNAIIMIAEVIGD